MKHLRALPPSFTITMGLCLWYFCLTGAPVLIDPDTAWHLAAGDLWRLDGFISVDPWGFTSTGKAWINIAWAFDVAISWLQTHTGFALLYPLCLMIVSVLIGLQVVRARAEGAIAVVLVLVTPLLVFNIYSGTLLRPNLVTLVLTLASYNLLISSAPLWRKRCWFLLPLITVLWVNTHGGFLYLFLLLFVFWLEAMIKNDWREAIRIIALGLLCLGCVGINPYAYQIVGASFQGMGTSFNTIINEWKPINFRENMRMLALLVLLLVGSGFTDTRIRIADRLLVFILFYLTLSSQRHSVMLSLFCIPYLGITLTYVVREMPQLRFIETIFDHILAKAKAEDVRIVSAMMLVFVLAFVFSPWPRDMLLKKPIGISRELVAEEDLAYVREHYADAKVLNHYDLGGHLIYYGRGNPKLFIDGRSNTAYPEQVLTDYRDFMQFAGQDLKGRAVHKKYGFKAVLIPNNIEEKAAWDDNYFWKRVHEGSSFSIYELK